MVLIAAISMGKTGGLPISDSHDLAPRLAEIRPEQTAESLHTIG